MTEIFAIFLYFAFLFSFAKIRRKGAMTQGAFVIGNRSLDKWTTALAAQASDMSNWLFMAYPGMVFIKGGAHVWAAVGLILIMWVNWKFIAPKIRIATEKSGSVTLCGFFESKLGSAWPSGRILTALFLFIFYTVYVAAILCGVGLLLHALFAVPYALGVVIGMGLVLPLLFMGGYSTLADVDLFQGLFLLAVILFVPVFVCSKMGGLPQVVALVAERGKSMSLFAGSSHSLLGGLLLMLGWGLGYFGQPHVLTKFMGIRNPSDLKFSMKIGMSWQITSLLAATFVGFVGIAAYEKLSDPQMVFIDMVRLYFPPFLSGVFLCAIIAAIVNAMSSMLLVLSTTVSEDFFKRFSKKEVSDKQLLFVSRAACVASALIALVIAMPNFASINALVEYAWSGLGATFGPLLIAFLFAPHVSKKSAWLGMFTGGFIVCIWPFVPLEIPALTVAFPLSLIVLFSMAYRGSETRGETTPS